MSTKMSDNISRPKITYMPIIVEPAFPTFTLRPIKGNLNQQTANLIIVNTSPHKLIFKIVPKSSDVSYSIRPEIDYLAPNGCRLVGISINQAPQPKRKHDFTYKVLALNPNESFGISAVQFWEQNQLENNGWYIEKCIITNSTSAAPLQEAQFVCLEAEVESSLDSSKRSVPRVRRKRIDNEPKLSSSADDPIRMRRRVSSLDHSETSNYPQQKLSLHYKFQSIFLATNFYTA
uniref:Major sperm protein n=1 Tax=Elaeophora elaphi TaxID=1147741 RepID=A0A0R3RJ52_9BILA